MHRTDTWQLKVHCIHLVFVPDAQILVRFSKRPVVYKLSHILYIDYLVKRPQKGNKKFPFFLPYFRVDMFT